MSQKELIKAIQNSDESSFNDLIEKNKTLDAASFKGAQIGAMTIHTVDCSNTEWEACIFDSTRFENLNLQGAYFNGCTFHDCVFSKTILAEASFDGCVLHKCKIVDTEDLEAIEITNSQFKECVLENMHFVDGTLQSLTVTSGAMKSISGIADLKSIVLRNVDVSDFDTSEMSISSCTASGCTSIPKGFIASEGKRRRV